MPRETRILHCVTGLGTTGSTTLLLRNLRALDRRRFRSYVCCLTRRTDLAAEVRGLGVQLFDGRYRGRWSAPAAVLHLARLLRKHRIDVVHTNGGRRIRSVDFLIAGLAGRLARVPVLVTLHSYDPGAEAGGDVRRGSLLGPGLLETWLARKLADRFVAVSRTVEHAFVEGGQVRNEEILTIPNALPLEEWTRPPAPDAIRSLRRELELPDSGPVLVTVGRLHPIKGHRWLIPMIETLQRRWSGCRLLVVGEGSERKSLEEEIAAAGLEHSIRLLGHRRDVRTLLELCDVFVFPSHDESMGYAALEATAAGVPVVCSDVGGLREIVEDGVNGYRVPPRDADALAAAVAKLLEDDRASRFGRRGAEIARARFDLRTSVERLGSLYESFAGSSVKPEGGPRDRTGDAPPAAGPPSRQRPLVARTAEAALARSPLCTYFRWRTYRRLAVLAYHGVPDGESFERQMAQLRSRWHPIHADELLRALAGTAGLPRRAVLVTFDDGQRSVVERALPALQAHGIPGIVFPVASLVGTDEPFWWDEVTRRLERGAWIDELPTGPAAALAVLKRLPDAERRRQIETLRRTDPGPEPTSPQLTPADLRRLEESGVEVGNHTWSHPCLDRCCDEEIRREVVRAHDRLAALSSQIPRTFAYPNGNHDARAAAVLVELGYRAAFLFDHRVAGTPLSDPLAISRIRVDASSSPGRFRLLSSGLHPFLHHALGRP